MFCFNSRLPRLTKAAPEATATAEPPLLPPATTQELGSGWDGGGHIASYSSKALQ